MKGVIIMARKQIEANLNETGHWYKVPEYKVMLVRDSGTITAPKKAIKSPDDVSSVFQSYIDGMDREVFVIAMLDRKGNLLGLNTVSVGGLFSAPVHPREVFKPAIIIGAASIILCHNHPSGNSDPSKEDIDVTKRLAEAGELLGIEILDHVVIGDGGYTSLKSRGLI